jgi:predicted nucleic acid-binding protein
VLHELICYPELNDFDRKYLLELPRLPTTDQTWISASKMRKNLLQRKKKARVVDSLIAQICIENSLKLISDDRDMKAYVHFGLKLL